MSDSGSNEQQRRARLQELEEKLGHLPLSELSTQELKELRDATEGMFRPSNLDANDDPASPD